MKTQTLIINNSKSNHLEYILKYFKDADEIWMATAFLKVSGLKLLLPALNKHIKANKPLEIIAGQNFGLTEPIALKTILELCNNKLNANLYLDKAENKQSVFHPKIFLFKHKNKGIIISGSANITNGGLVTNEEFSICMEVDISSSQWNEALAYFKQITDTKNADLMSLVLLNRYEQFYNEQKKARIKQKVVPDKKSSEYSFDYSKLVKRLKTYRDANYLKKLNERIEYYKEAKLLLDEIAETDRLTQNRFEEIIDDLVGKKGTFGLWHSGSLLRLRFKVYKCKKEFRALVQFIKNNQDLSANKVFNGGKLLVEKIDGARINYVTEIMMTYQPTRFANLNTNPITVLKKEAGVYYKSHSSSFNGDDYQAYCSVIEEICKKLNLKNMLEVDSFFNSIYWKIKEEEKEK